MSYLPTGMGSLREIADQREREMRVVVAAVQWKTVFKGPDIAFRRHIEDMLLDAVTEWQRGNVAALERDPAAVARRAEKGPWPPDCDLCGRPLAERGAILVSPPIDSTQAADLVRKKHVCVGCYDKIFSEPHVRKNARKARAAKKKARSRKGRKRR